MGVFSCVFNPADAGASEAFQTLIHEASNHLRTFGCESVALNACQTPSRDFTKRRNVTSYYFEVSEKGVLKLRGLSPVILCEY